MTDFRGKQKNKSIIKQTLEKKKDLVNNKSSSNFKVSFQYLDSNQKYASTFRDWQKDGLLSYCMETLHGYCTQPLLKQVDGSKFTIYGDFPKDEDTLFKKPQHVPPDANWARIHINGKAVVVGHIVNEIFYVVFLDKTHRFWLTKKDKEKFKGIKK